MSRKTDKPTTVLLPSEPADILQRLFLARVEIRSMPLWQNFEIQRSFDAFSIHKLASAIEPVINAQGVTSEFHPTKWHKSGNHTLIEGNLVFTCPETLETHTVPSIGEGVDGSDKGVGKALSYARKNALICYFNLSIGIDNEADDQESSGVHASSEVPQTAPATKQMAPQARSSSGTYAWTSLDGEIADLSPAASVNEIVNYLRSLSALDIETFLVQNEDTIKVFAEHEKGFWFAIDQQIKIAKSAKAA